MNQLMNDLIILLNDVGRGFCNHAAGIFVQSSVLILLLLAVNVLLRKRVRAVFRYCLWMLVFVKLVLPTSLALPTSIAYWLGDYWPSETSASTQMPAIEPAIPVAAAPTIAVQENIAPSGVAAQETVEPVSPTASAALGSV